MKSIFDLIESKEELSSTNQGMAKLEYDEIQPLRGIVDTNTNAKFADGIITLRWHYDNGRWYLPSRSYIKMIIEIKKNGGNPLLTSDQIGVAMGLPHSLFAQAQYKISNKMIDQITNNYPQIAAYKTRSERPREWLESTGTNTNFWGSDLNTRIREISQDGFDKPNLQYDDVNSALDWSAITQYDAADTVTFDYDNGNEGESEFAYTDNANANQVLFRAGGAVDGALDAGLIAVGIDVGKYIRFTLFDDGNPNAPRTYVSKILRIETAAPGDANNNINNKIIIRRISAVEADLAIVADANNTLAHSIQVLNNINEKRQVRTFEVFFQPSLSMYEISSALPGGSKHELTLLPYTNTIYQKNGIQSVESKDHPTDYRFQVKDLRLYNAVCDGPLIEKKEFMLDLEVTRCQLLEITSGTSTQYSIDVSPSTNKLGFAFQDGRVLSDTRFLNTKFNIGTSNLELGITKFYCRYGGLQLPNPDYDPSYNDTNALANNIEANTDKLTELYFRNIMYNGGYYDSSQEKYSEWRDRGIMLSFPIAKTATARETRAYVKVGFDNLADDIELKQNGKILVFDTYKKVAIIKMDNGKVYDIMINDV